MRSICLLFLVLILFSCQNKAPEYKSVAQNVEYKFLKFGEGAAIEKGKSALMYITVLDTLGDTLHYVPNYPYFSQIGSHPIDSVFLELAEGDSAHIRVNRKDLNSYMKFYEPLQSDEGVVELRVSIQKVLKIDEAIEEEQKLLSEREIQEQADLKAYLDDLRETGIEMEQYDGIYRIRLDSTNGDAISYGDQVSISYRGKFMNGYVFDDTDEKGISPTFRYGEDFQLIEGVESGLKDMREGESVKIILPSRRAFGEEGSLAGIVPPFTTVIFEIKIIKIEK